MVTLKCFIFILFGIFKLIVAKSVYTSIIKTDNGPIQGEILTTVRRKIKYAGFKGIPYAEPPLGYLRFKPPIAKKSWTNVLDATKEGHICSQIDLITKDAVGSEDCLILNVYTPFTDFRDLKPKNLKAVMVWIYGGGFTIGRSTFNNYGPDFLIEDDVILVSINYRLGPFGFLNINHPNATGNAGLKDQHLALKWVNKNIDKFGGDPNKVTIFGQSAGAVSVDLHVLSDMSKGLFSRSIAMSGSPLCLYWGMQSHREAQSRAFELGSKLGVKTRSKNELMKILYVASSKDIILKAHNMFLMPFRPTIESKFVAKNQKKFLTRCALDKYRFGKYNKVPHMTGFTSNEAKLITSSDLVDLITSSQPSLENVTSPRDSQILQRFITEGDYSKISNELVNNIISWASDLFFVTGIDSKQKLMQWHNKHPVYYYRFAYESGNATNNYNTSGVAHAEELRYLFHISRAKLSFDNPEVDNMINKFVRLMTNFAKYGNPTPKGKDDPLLGITWPNSGIFGRHLEINKNLMVQSRPVSPGVEINQIAGIGTTRKLTNCY